MIISGVVRLGRDAELKFTSNAKPVLSFSGVYNYGMKGDDGKRPSQWVNCRLWGALAEKLAPYMLKGTTAWITGRDLHVREWEKGDKHGAALEVTVTEIQLVGSRDEKPAEKEEKPAPIKGSKFDSLEDDIPF